MRDIKNYEGLYAVTSCGKVWSYKNKKFLKPFDNGNGYLYVMLYKDGHKKNYRIHRLVAETYIDNPHPEEWTVVNHIDGCRTHNWVSNLEWTTQKHNVNVGNRVRPVYCEETGEVYESVTAAAAAIKGEVCGLCFCCIGRQKSYLGKHWRYATEDEIYKMKLNKETEDYKEKLKKQFDELTDLVISLTEIERLGSGCNILPRCY